MRIDAEQGLHTLSLSFGICHRSALPKALHGWDIAVYPQIRTRQALSGLFQLT